MSGARLKSIALIAGIALGGLTLISWTQQWFTVTLVADELGGGSFAVGGDIAAGSLAALGLSSLALVGALSIAGRLFRIILGILQVLLGATVTLTAVLATTNPVSASAGAVSEATGISGAESVAALVDSTTATPWPFIAIALGVGAVILGILIVVTSPRWPDSARKYQAVRFDHADGDTGSDTVDPSRSARGAAGQAAVEPRTGARASDSPPDAVADWDALSDGSDPTAR
ncbi:Trp biosynthesis-associated membrane protein [Marisediminicola senii]|uniref:Trp biosynthesis-associated membrane protein n=1 Tax=Marisediminicola senii TaxID=2711233 RepID=UPI0013EC5CF3|nr:Trp biosynthesis-associated membrane protein [Marisediminicola senii]